MEAHRAQNSDQRRTEIPFQLNDDLRMARTLLRFADLGIDDVEVVEQPEGEGPRLDLRFVHRTRSETASFRPDEESDGTRTWFRLIGPALAALHLGAASPPGRA